MHAHTRRMKLCNAAEAISAAAQGACEVAGQVLDISKHENAVARDPAWRTTRTASGKRARIYSFPAPAAAVSNAPEAPKRRLRLHLAVELAIGFMLWLSWYIWHHLH
jgi:hypothetical protein